MPKFKVCFQQYIEMLATIEVEADDEHVARQLARDLASKAEWEVGDDTCGVAAYAVYLVAGDDDDRLVWER
jgi:chaperonin GroEL (HSP60 family)